MTRWAEDAEIPVADDLEEAFTLPARYYTDPAVLEAEREQVFARTWQYVGDLGQLDEPGGFVVRDVADRSIVVTRGEDGELHGLHNVCAHRGSRIIDDDEGARRRFQCPYHGWTYRLDGSFVGAPNFEDGALDQAANSLRPVTVGPLGPMVFATVESEPEPLAASLGSVAEDLEPFDLGAFQRVRTVEYPVDCNWKVYVDNYLECYHCHLNHPSFVESLDMDGYEIETFDTYVAQYGEIDRDSEMDSGARDRVDPAVRDRYVSVWLWPNVTIDVTPRSLEVCRIRPDDHANTTLVVDYYNRDGEPTAAWREGLAFSQQVMREDIELCERQFDGLASGVFNQGQLGPEEHGAHRFQTLVQDHLEV